MADDDMAKQGMDHDADDVDDADEDKGEQDESGDGKEGGADPDENTLGDKPR